MALLGRAKLAHPATLSRFLAALDPGSVEALRTLFQDDLEARPAFASPPGGVWDRQGQHWTVVDVDGTKQAARQRALPQTADLPAPHRRFDLVSAPGYLGRKRGEVVRTRTTVLQAHTHQWLGSFGNAGQWRLPGRIAAGARGDIELCQQTCSAPLSRVGALRLLVRQCRSGCRSARPCWAWGGRAWKGLPPVGPACRERAVAPPPRSADEAS